MGFRTGVIVGLGVGYVLGARAGRERYEEIVSAAETFRASDTGRAIETSIRDVIETAEEELPEVFDDVLGDR